ncbi:histidine phosphatase family protein [Sphingomonas sp.]|jgi:phosphohistidine phosphatase SixA|uniref:SixA phosphatase family protein n=1 Tax=Sphingomonas sp. TaxID=28214 RepID=UPI002DE4578B|nr:histidine phosphatase family protein [Sphingomonas sp.]
MTKHSIAAIAGVFLASVAHAAPVYVMRHLERDAGKDPSLNAIGTKHSEELATWFRRDRPKAIFVTQFRRAQETVAPLAKRLRITPIRYDPGKPEAMLSQVKASKGPVLIVGHSNTVPKIVEELGGPAGPDLADTDYGRIWIIRDGKVTVTELGKPQPR